MSSYLVRLSVNGNRAEKVLLHRGGDAEQEPPEEVPPVHAAAVRELARLAEAHPEAWLAWHDRRLEPWLSDPASWPGLTRSPLQILHLGCLQRTDLLAKSLGFVDFDSPWLLPGPANRRFTTWLISPAAGICRAEALRALAPHPSWESFAGFLFDLGGRGIRHGLSPSSDPGLLGASVPEEVWTTLREPLPQPDLARLLRRGYGRRWIGFWLLACLLFDRKLPWAAALRGWASGPPGQVDEEGLAALHPRLAASQDASVDALIPTLGRPGPLRDVLDDLGRQTLPPRRVIVVDQGGTTPKPAGEWPFELVFLSLPTPGACRARNAGLREVRSDWVLMLDDDVRLRPGLISYLVGVGRAYGVEAVNAAVHLQGQDPGRVAGSPFVRPWAAFGTCAALVASRALEEAGGFDEQLEGGYGEDYDLGVRLRLAGTDVLYAPGEPVLHLKAPVGGFRHPFVPPWSTDPVPPRPSPVLLYSRRKHHPRVLRDGYRLYYALKRLRGRPVLAWLREVREISQQWERATWWADRITENAGGQP